MRYLVTGGAGFIGSHLVEALLVRGDQVLVMDDFSTGRRSNLGHLASFSERQLQVVDATVMDYDVPCDLDVVWAVDACDAVFHLASAVGVKTIMQETVKSMDTIGTGTANVLSACRYAKKPVLITSTSEVYGKSTAVPFHEDADCVLGAPSYRRWSYATAKLFDEHLALAYYREHELPVIVARLFNTVGPRQSAAYGMVVPRFVKQALAGEPLTIYGDGTQSRSFCHVADTVECLIRLMNCQQAFGQIVNVGRDREITINGLAELVIERTKSRSTVTRVPQPYGAGFEDIQRRVPDLTKLIRLTGYFPERGTAQIVDDVVAHLQSA